MFKVEYDPDRHIYSIDGRQVPGITAILKEVGLIDYDHVNPGILENAEVPERIYMMQRSFMIAGSWMRANSTAI